MNSFFRLLPLVTLFFFVAFLSPGVLAQSLNDNSYSNPQPFVASGTNSIISTVAKGNQNIFSADLKWTIPFLLAAAVILYIRSEEKVAKRYYNPSTGYEIAYNQIKRKNRKFKFKRHLKAA